MQLITLLTSYTYPMIYERFKDLTCNFVSDLEVLFIHSIVEPSIFYMFKAYKVEKIFKIILLQQFALHWLYVKVFKAI